MTEAEWLACPDPSLVLEFLRGRGAGTERRMRLLGAANCRRLWHLLTDDRSREAVRVSERYADGAATADELATAEWYAEAAVFALDAHADAARYRLEQRLIRTGWLTEDEATSIPPPHVEEARQAAQAAELAVGGGVLFPEGADHNVASLGLIRDIFGDPFKPVALDPAWLSSDVLNLARGAYQDRALDRLPILADALADAGCECDELLGHLRGGGEHVLGCWGLDAVLRKS